MNRFTFRRVMLAVGLLTVTIPAFAHKVGISHGEYIADGASVSADLTFARPEIAALIIGLDANHNDQLSDEELVAGRDLLASTFVNGLVISTLEGGCRGELKQVALTDNDGLAVRVHYQCLASPTSYRLRLSLLTSLSVGHRHLVSVRNAATDAVVSQVVYESSPDFEITGQAATASNKVAGPLFALGVEHILTGFDHLLFLLGVILVGVNVRELLIAITAFTLAHSVTLGLAALGILAPSPDVVEPAIALSIVYVGIENWFVKDASKRWLLTFPFGLIHGFGFAGALREIALPNAQIPLALVSFNLGVEAGQIAILALALPILFWLRHRPRFRTLGVRSTSALIAVAGMVWFVQRVS